MEKRGKKSGEIIEGSLEWVNELIDRIMDEAYKNYFIKPKKGKKKRYIPKQLYIKKVKHKFADTNFVKTLK